MKATCRLSAENEGLSMYHMRDRLVTIFLRRPVRRFIRIKSLCQYQLSQIGSSATKYAAHLPFGERLASLTSHRPRVRRRSFFLF